MPTRVAPDLRLLIVEDDLRANNSLQELFASLPGVQVVGACASAEEALQILESAQPDVLLSDLGLPDMSGIELIRKAKTLRPALEVIVLTVSENRGSVFAALKAGAHGYIVKSARRAADLEAALSLLREGGSPMSPRIARMVTEDFHDRPPSEPSPLSKSEKPILEFLRLGYSYKQIAKETNISVHTVHTHIRNIYEKLQARGRADALAKAESKGIL